MKQVLKVGDVSAEPGQKNHGPATWVELKDGSRVNLPVILVNGRGEGPKVVINCATHPTELVGYAAIQILTRKVDPAKLKGSIVAFPISNPLGMQWGEYVSPHDYVNMYVAYPGSKDGSITSRLANFIWENASKSADLVMDVHENVKPCLHFSYVEYCKDKNVENRALEAAKAFGFTVIRPKGSFALAGMKPGDVEYVDALLAAGVPAFTPELEAGTDLTLGEEWISVRAAVRGLMNVLKKLEMIEGTPEPQTDVKVFPGNFAFYGMSVANRGGIVNRLVDVGVKLKKDTPIATVQNAYGEVIETCKMPIDGYLWGWNIGSPPNFNWAVQSGDSVAFIYQDA
ncbi:MAG: succinylglutamate desuccinylase/aspartoacylase family protein [Candidatus Bathyarchaeia archaeon]